MRALPALAFAAALGLTFVVAMHTQQGLHDDAALRGRVSGVDLARVRAAGGTALSAIDVVSTAIAAVAIAGLAVVRGKVGRAGAALAVIALSIGSAELLKHGLPVVAGRQGGTFPSGHVAVAASLGLALVFAAPPVLRPLAAVAGAAYAAGIALAVVVLGWHYPSDAVGAFCVAGFWASLLGGGRRPSLSVRGLVLAAAAVAVGLVVAALVASRHPLSVEAVRSRRSLVAAAAAFGVVSLATFATVAPLADER